MSGALLLVEDEAFIAIETQMSLEEAGETAIEICTTRDEAMAFIADTAPRAAILDFNLGLGETSTDVALKLVEMNVPFAFLTGYTEASMKLPSELDNVPHFSKPCHTDELLDWLRGL